jgi:hypothetical protein
MELVAILRVLWRRRILVALGGLLTVAVVLLVANRESSHSGLASTRLLLDTPDSQLIHPLPEGAESLAWRASLLAEQMASKAVKRRIADHIRAPADALVVLEPRLTEPTVPTPLSVRASEAAAATSEAYVLYVGFDDQLPIISLAARGPNRRAATRLTDAAVHALKAAGSPPRDSRELQPLVVDRVGPIRARQVVSSPSPLVPVGIFIAAFGVWCACVVLIPSNIRRVRFRPVEGGPADLTLG